MKCNENHIISLLGELPVPVCDLIDPDFDIRDEALASLSAWLARCRSYGTPGKYLGTLVICESVHNSTESLKKYAIDNLWRDSPLIAHALGLAPINYSDTGYVISHESPESREGS